jgi:hypothetical protein
MRMFAKLTKIPILFLIVIVSALCPKAYAFSPKDIIEASLLDPKEVWILVHNYDFHSDITEYYLFEINFNDQAITSYDLLSYGGNELDPQKILRREAPVVYRKRPALIYANLENSVYMNYLNCQNKVVTQTLLPPRKKKPILGLWLIKYRSKRYLFSFYSEYAGVPDLDNHWLDCYELRKGKSILKGKQCLDRLRTGFPEIRCAPGEDGIAVWKRDDTWFSGKMLCYADWRDSGRLKWHKRYVSDSFWMFEVDPKYGQVCLVGDEKLYAVRSNKTKVKDLSKYDINYSWNRGHFLKITGQPLYLLSGANNNGIRICVLNAKFDKEKDIKISFEEFDDYHLVNGPDGPYIIILQGDKFFLSRLPLKPSQATTTKPVSTTTNPSEN